MITGVSLGPRDVDHERSYRGDDDDDGDGGGDSRRKRHESPVNEEAAAASPHARRNEARLARLRTEPNCTAALAPRGL